MFDGMGSVPATAAVDVAVDGRSMALVRSATTANGLETMEGVAEGDVVTLTVSDGAGVWSLDPLVVPPPPTSMIPMPELIYTSVALTAATAWWMARRTARAWRRTTLRPGAPGFSTGGSMG
jgi:hypothetical protein